MENFKPSDKYQTISTIDSHTAGEPFRIVVPRLGNISYDLGFGGAFYAFVNAREVGLECTPDYFGELAKKGRMIKNVIMASKTINHILEQALEQEVLILQADMNF
jgi:proline racemase